MEENREDTPLAKTPVPVTSATLMEDLKKASDARLKAKREARKAEKTKQEKPTLTGPPKLQGLASLGIIKRKTK